LQVAGLGAVFGVIGQAIRVVPGLKKMNEGGAGGARHAGVPSCCGRLAGLGGDSAVRKMPHGPDRGGNEPALQGERRVVEAISAKRLGAAPYPGVFFAALRRGLNGAGPNRLLKFSAFWPH